MRCSSLMKQGDNHNVFIGYIKGNEHMLWKGTQQKEKEGGEDYSLEIKVGKDKCTSKQKEYIC